MLLRDVAHTRSGDKGNLSTICVVAFRLEDYPLVERNVTADRVRTHYAGIVQGKVERYTLPALGALNFVLHDALGGGVTRSLALDAHGKCLASSLLSLPVD